MTKEPEQNSGEMGPPLTGPGLGLHNLLTISAWGWSFPWRRSTQNLEGSSWGEPRPEAKEVVPGAGVSGLLCENS